MQTGFNNLPDVLWHDARQTAAQLTALYPESNFVLLELRQLPATAPQIVHQAWPGFEPGLLNSENSLQGQPAGWIGFENLHIYLYLIANAPAQPIFVFEKVPPESLRTLMEEQAHKWRETHAALVDLNNQDQIQCGNLVSQLLHDVQSLTHLGTFESGDAQLRLAYQEKVNQNLLTYIRPLELLNSRMPLKDLVHSTLETTQADKNKFKPGQITDDIFIDADAELFSIALNEIMLNAQLVQPQAKGPCRIGCRLLANSWPTAPKAWIQITVEDDGPGIKPEYLPQVTEPFFTTRKYEGYSGFGLALVKKIMAAHGGTVEICNGNVAGTKVVLSFPVYDQSKNTNY